MAVLPYNFDEGKIILVPATNAVAFDKGEMVIYTSGLADVAVGAQGTDVPLVSASTITTTSTGQLIPCWVTTGNPLFIADTDAVWSTVDQGTLADLATSLTIDPDASDDDLFFILKGVGTAETDTKVIGYFSQANET